MYNFPHTTAAKGFGLAWFALTSTVLMACEPIALVDSWQDGDEYRQVAAEHQESKRIANANYRRALESFETLRPLATRGAVSRSQLSDARLRLRVAELELDSVREPDREPANKIAISKARLEHAAERLEVSKRLWANRSVSQLQHRRTSYNYRFAKLTHQALVGEIARAKADTLIASLKAELAKIEFDLATKLFARRAISKSTLNAMRDRMQQTETELQKHLSKQREKQKRDANRLRA